MNKRVDIQDLGYKDYKQTWDYQEQLFKGTILENIAVGRPAATFEYVRWVVKHMGLEDWIRQQPEGYETVLRPEGKTLPRGIIQRLLLARAIAAKPKLLLLMDEFDALSMQERTDMIDFLTHPDRPWTLLVASGDAYWTKKTNRTVYLQNGRIVTYDAAMQSLNRPNS